MHVLTTVSRELGLGDRVYTRPYALTLYEFMTLRELDSIDEVIAESRRVAQAGLAAVAFHEPEKLMQENARLADMAGTTPTPEEREAEKIAAQAEADEILAGFAAAERKAKLTGRA